MKKTLHIFEEGYYFIHNKSVAKSFMFKDGEDCIRFKSNIKKHLDPICDVLAFGFLKEEFQLVIKMKCRKEIEAYFVTKYSQFYEDHGVIPETTYIFSRAMANLQSAYVKWFNFKYSRDGGLMSGRYQRMLINSEKELNDLIESVNDLKKCNVRNMIWTFRRKDGFFIDPCSTERSSAYLYEMNNSESIPSWFKRKQDVFVRGQFESTPPRSLNAQKQNIQEINMRFCFKF